MNRNTRTGLIAGLASHVIGGFFPIYWKLLAGIPAMKILAWRLVGCGVLAWTFVLILRRRTMLQNIQSAHVVTLLIFATILICLNWAVYVWTVTTGHILDASLGYYINPLVNVVLGAVFLGERIGRIRKVAMALALVGVIVMTIAAGVFPWRSVTLALCFGFYGLTVKKLPSRIDSIEIMAWHTALLSPIAIAYIVVLGRTGSWHITTLDPLKMTLLLASGIPTFFSLWLFSMGLRRLPLGVMGFLQYIAPSLMLALGALVYEEPFGLLRGTAFILVAIALGLYSSTLKDS